MRTKHLALLQKIFRYAAPLLVAVESTDQLSVPDKARDILQASLWWNLLLTTRVLIAHATILVDANHVFSLAKFPVQKWACLELQNIPKE